MTSVGAVFSTIFVSTDASSSASMVKPKSLFNTHTII